MIVKVAPVLINFGLSFMDLGELLSSYVFLRYFSYEWITPSHKVAQSNLKESYYESRPNKDCGVATAERERNNSNPIFF